MRTLRTAIASTALTLAACGGTAALHPAGPSSSGGAGHTTGQVIAGATSGTGSGGTTANGTTGGTAGPSTSAGSTASSAGFGATGTGSTGGAGSTGSATTGGAGGLTQLQQVPGAVRAASAHFALQASATPDARPVMRSSNFRMQVGVLPPTAP